MKLRFMKFFNFVTNNIKWFFLLTAALDFVDMFLVVNTAERIEYGVCSAIMLLYFGIALYFEKKGKKANK